MKIKASKKEIKENSYRILSIGYCDAQYLLRAKEPFSYCCGVYGWSCDNYELDNGKHRIVISTGYAPIGNQNIAKEVVENEYDIVKKYEEKARKINRSVNGWDNIKKRLDRLVNEFVEEVCKSEK